MRILLETVCIVVIILGLKVRDSFSSAADCTSTGQYVLHPSDRCKYIHCVYQPPWWGARRPSYLGVTRHCPYGRAVSRWRYQTVGGYRTRQLRDMCSELVSANPHWRPGTCQVGPPLHTRHVYSPLQRTSATGTIPKHVTSNAIQNDRQKPGRESFKKAYDNGGYHREELVYDLEATPLESEGQKGRYQEENSIYDEQQNDDSRAYYSNDFAFGDNSDYYVMEAEAGDAMLKSVSNMVISSEEEIMSPEESRLMTAEMIKLGFGKM